MNWSPVGLHAHDRDLVLGAQVGLAERHADQLLGGDQFGDHEVLVERQELEHLTGDEVCHAGAHLRFGEHDVVGADPLQDPAVRVGDRLGPHVLDAEVDEGAGGQHAGLDAGSDAHHGRDGIGDSDLAECSLARAVGLDDMGQHVGVILHGLLAEIDPEHLVAELDQGLGQRRSEPAEPDHDDLALVFDPIGRQPGQHVVDDLVGHVGSFEQLSR